MDKFNARIQALLAQLIEKESMKVHQDIVVRYQTKRMQYHQLKRSAVS
jgi:hypothetical protein